ncbi:MAG: hypothetical protein AAGA92_05485 [Planctomycetota bacterium]
MRLLCSVFAASLLMSLAQSASAIKPFQDVFVKEYVDEESKTELTELASSKRLACLICHQGKKKKHHNPYGEHLEDLLDKKKDAKNKEKILEALKKVAAMHSDPDDESSPTYGELIAEGKLPGGKLEDLKKEPEKKEEAESEEE